MTTAYDIILDDIRKWNSGDWYNKVIRTRQTIDPDYDIHKTLVTLAIEKTLLAFGTLTLHKVNDALKKYHFNMSDCYENPQHLKKVLKDLYDRSYDEITWHIQKELQEVAYHKKIEKFLRVLKS